jgi:hypothetical protein
MHKIIGLVAMLGIVGGGIYWYTNKPAGGPTSTETQSADSSEEGGLMSSLKDVVASGKAMHCTYTLDESGIVTESWIQGDKMRTESTVESMKTFMVADKDTHHIWNSANKQGMKITTACMEKMKQLTPAQEDKKMPSIQDTKAAFDFAKNVKCKPTSAVDTSVPTDITFTDQCAAMEDSMKMMEQMKDKMPAGMSMPAGQ